MKLPMKQPQTYIAPLLLALVLFFPIAAQAQTTIKVMAYPFPPFFNEDNRTGLTTDLIALLNTLQSDYRFELRPTSPMRRYQQFATQRADMVFFEMPQWGWDTSALGFETTREIMHGGEKYITAKIAGRGQEYFNDIKSRSISAYIGYHYGFADFNANPDWLRKHFTIGLHHSHERIIDLVLKNKVEIGVVTLSYLKQYLHANPQVRSKLLISENFDQKFHLRMLVRKDGPIDVATFEQLLDRLKENNQLRALFIANGLEDLLIY
jgi:hypothetical protein